MLTHENGFVKIPDDVPLEAAALIGCAVVTGVGAVLNTAKVEPGTTVAVFGAGGIGLSAIQGARIAGARRIIAVDINESKLAAARRFGATDTVDASASDPVAEIMKLAGDGVDYSFEAIGSKQTAEQCIQSLAMGGTATIIGIIPGSQRVEIDPMSLLAEKRVQGCLMGSVRIRHRRAALHRILQAGPPAPRRDGDAKMPPGRPRRSIRRDQSRRGAPQRDHVRVARSQTVDQDVEKPSRDRQGAVRWEESRPPACSRAHAPLGFIVGGSALCLARARGRVRARKPGEAAA